MMRFLSLLVGFLSDNFGRIILIQYSAIIYYLKTLLCSFYKCFYIIILFRCIANISIGVFNILSMNLLSAYRLTKNRCLYLMIYSSFYNFGNLNCAMLKIIFIDNQYYDITDWQIANFFSSIFGIISFVFVTIYVQESPIFLLQNQRINKRLLL